MSIFDIVLNHPLGSILEYTVRMVGSYGLGLVVFTFFTKVILLPLSLITQRSTIKQMKVRPYEEIIRKKCGADRQRAQLEVSALYKEHGISASSGCLPLLVQIPIMFSLYKIIRMPLTYMLKLSGDTILAIDEALGLGVMATGSLTAEVTVAEAMFANFDKLVATGVVDAGVLPVNYNFLGMNLASKPSFAVNMLLLIPIFAGVTAFAQSWYQFKSQPPTAAGAATSKTMLITMPIMSVWITFSLPAGVGLYWGMSNFFTVIQQMVLNSIMNPKKALAKAYEDMEEQQRLAKERKRELANQHRIESESRNRAQGGKKKGSQQPRRGAVTEAIINDELEEYEPQTPVRQQRPAGKPTKGGYQSVLGYTAIPDPIDEDIALEESRQESGKLKKNRPKPGSAQAARAAAPSDEADEADEVEVDEAAVEDASEDEA